MSGVMGSVRAEGEGTRKVEAHGVAESDLELVMMIQSGTVPERDRAFDALTRRHGGLIRRIVQRYASRLLPHDDLHQAALMATWAAAKSYDHTKGTKVSSYVGHCVENMMMREVQDAMRVKQEMYRTWISLGTKTREGEMSILDCIGAASKSDGLEEREWLETLIDTLLPRLSEKEREYFLLYREKGNRQAVTSQMRISRQRAEQLNKRIIKKARSVVADLDGHRIARDATRGEIASDSAGKGTRCDTAVTRRVDN
jgi:RNA polymerase sigma factor (sigma-70 family)